MRQQHTSRRGVLFGFFLGSRETARLVTVPGGAHAGTRERPPIACVLARGRRLPEHGHARCLPCGAISPATPAYS
jgi:hypothetical protein